MLSEIYFLEYMAKERRQAFEKEAMRLRLIRQAKRQDRFSIAPAFDFIAEILIKSGCWIRVHYGKKGSCA